MLVLFDWRSIFAFLACGAVVAVGLASSMVNFCYVVIDEHCSKIEPEMVVTYCTACDAGLKAGGKKSLSLLELVAGVASSVCPLEK